MILLVGLGNPGKQYEKTRHNIGFMVLDFLAEGEKWSPSRGAKALYLKKTVNGKEVELLKPLTFMNNSGFSVSYVQRKHRLPISNIIVIHDDKDIPLGKIKIQQNRGAAGHHGVQSIIDQLGTKNFVRFRIGIAPLKPTRQKGADFVLSKFSKEEEKKLTDVLKRAEETVKTIILEYERPHLFSRPF